MSKSGVAGPSGTRGAYPWVVLGLLWFCGFFNYADRQAVNSVFPMLAKEFSLSDIQLGVIGSAFMIVYATTSPFAGYVVDRVRRRILIPAGLAFWSLICAATGLSSSFAQLVFFRGAEGLGESFYFPASLSFLADYHGRATRSRALGIHQTSVYLGTAGGAALAGKLAEHYGWRSPFYALGLAGLVYAVILGFLLIEPKRGQSDAAKGPGDEDFGIDELEALRAHDPISAKASRILGNPAALLLLCVFVGANFVASAFLTWLPTFLFRKFTMGIAASSLTSTVWPLASLFGALLGGLLADLAAARRRGGRILVQALGLILGAPFVFATGWTESRGLTVVAMAAAGLCKGIYDANIFASLFDVVRPEDRGTAAGLMNSLGWAGGFLAPVAVGAASNSFGLDVAIASTALVYLLVGMLALAAAKVAEAGTPSRETDILPPDERPGS
ncbi:putative galactarate transporter [Aquisphaera giovannonii]|uniref:Putative galactarate transporter n=1 Tax=Aquisphaera giovannonii TaxID=406548 RepID=A0A5B9W804_9BACT|nr:MFS transporter [Aquisphaera giovannonii]QEH36822.1 putative galactarate transporter [Aquisphaera giovannonii]